MAKLTLDEDFGGLNKGLQETIENLKELDQEAKKTSQDISNGFNKSADNQKKFRESTNKSALSVKKFVSEEEKLVRKINQLNAEQKELRDELKKLTKGTSAYTLSQIALRRNTQELNAALKKTDTGLKKVAKEIKKTRKSNELFRKGMKKIAVSVVGALAVLAALRRGLIGLVGSQAKFNAELADLSAITGAVGGDLLFYRQSALEVARSNELGTVSAGEFLNALKLVGSAKPDLLKAKEALVETTKAAILLSQASGNALEPSTKALTSVMNQFSKSASEANDIVNILAAGAKFGSGNVGFLSDAIVRAGITLKNANVSLEETTALLEVLAEKGIIARKSGTGLRNTILILQKDTANYKDGIFDINLALENLNKIQGDSIALEKQFGKENVTVATALAQNVTQFNRLTKAVTGTNVANEQAAARTNNLIQNWAKLKNAFQAFLIGNSRIARGLNTLTKGLARLFKTAGEGEVLLNALKAERVELRLLQLRLTSTTTSEEERLAIIIKLKEEYPELLSNINAETSSNEDLNTALKGVNDQLVNKIVLQKQDNDITKKSEEAADNLQKALNAEDELLLRIERSARAYGVSLSEISEGTPIEKSKEFNKILKEIQQSASDDKFRIGITNTMTKIAFAARELSVANSQLSKSHDNLTTAQEKRVKAAARLGLDEVEADQKANQELLDAQSRLNTDLDKLQAIADKAALDLTPKIARINKIKDLALEEIDILETRIRTNNKLVNDSDKLSIEQEINLTLARRSIRKKASDDINKLTKGARDKEIQLRQKAEKELQASLKKLRQQAVSSELELASESDTERIDLIEQASNDALDIIRNEILDRKVALGQARELTEEEEELLATIRLAIRKKTTDELLKLQEGENEKSIALSEAKSVLEIELLTESGDKQLTLEEFKAKEILKVQLRSAELRLALIKNQESETATALKTTIAQIKGELKGFIESSDLSVGEELIKALFKVDDAAAKKILKDITDVGNVLGTALGDAFQTGIDKAVDANAKIIDAIDQKIQKAEEAVEEEKRLSDLGFSNSQSDRQRELNALESDRDQAIKLQEEAVKKQQILDKASAAASMTVAIANILKTFTGLGPVGLILAGAAITGLLALFSSSVAQANTISLEKGSHISSSNSGTIKGKRHSAKGESLLSQVNVEQGEDVSVFNRTASAKHRPLIKGFTDAINGGNPLDFFSNPDFSSMNLLSDRKNQFISNSISTKAMERNQRRGNEHLQAIKNKQTSTSVGTKTIIKYGNTTKIIR